MLLVLGFGHHLDGAARAEPPAGKYAAAHLPGELVARRVSDRRSIDWR